MSSQFPYQYGLIDGRKIAYPIVIVFLETIRGRRAYSFIMDTGSDHLTLPHHMINLLGVSKKDLVSGRAQGVGKTLVQTKEGKIPITFCRQTFTVHVSFTDHDKTPFLLGRDDIFDRFNVIFDNDNQVAVFENRK